MVAHVQIVCFEFSFNRFIHSVESSQQTELFIFYKANNTFSWLSLDKGVHQVTSSCKTHQKSLLCNQFFVWFLCYFETHTSINDIQLGFSGFVVWYMLRKFGDEDLVGGQTSVQLWTGYNSRNIKSNNPRLLMHPSINFPINIYIKMYVLRTSFCK